MWLRMMQNKRNRTAPLVNMFFSLPPQIFDMGRLAVIAGPKGLQPGDELTVRFTLSRVCPPQANDP